MRLVQRSVALALMLLLAACSSTEHLTRAYESAAVRIHASPWRGFEVTQGDKLVLENSHSVSSLPFVVDGIRGYRVHIELGPQGIAKGMTIAIPSEQGKAFLYRLAAPSYRNVEVFGTVRIAGVSVQADLKSNDPPWAMSGIETYWYARHSCLGKVDWACEFYAK
jgi:hypothetical protein